MKKIIFFLLVYSLHTNAQFDNQELVGKILPAKIIYRGEKKIMNVQMRYETPDNFCNPYAKFLIYDPQTNWIIKDSTINAALVEAFCFNNNAVWYKTRDPKYPEKYKAMHPPNPGYDEMYELTHARLLLQGAIYSFAFTHKKLIGYAFYTYSGKRGVRLMIDSDLASIESQVRDWVSDSPEIKRELFQADSLTASNRKRIAELRREDSITKAETAAEEKRKGLGKLIDNSKSALELNERIRQVGPTRTDMNIIVHNYNAWYEKNNPGKINYELIDPPVRQSSQLELVLEARNKTGPVKKEAVEPDIPEDAFTKRGTTASPEMASVKDNIPVKKETFAAKMDRIKADGNKIGVVYVVNPVRTKPKPGQNAPGSNTMGSSMGEDVYLEGEYNDESLLSLGKDFTAELNTALGRTDIELVDINNVPYRDGKVMGLNTKIDNWWATKYKVIFVYTVDPVIGAFLNTMSGKNTFEATLNFGSSVVLTEYIGAPDSKDKDNVTQMSNMGAFVSPKLSQEKRITDIKELFTKVIETMNAPLLEKIKTERASGVKKLVEKKLAP